MKRVADKVQLALNTILSSDENIIAYVYYRLAEVVKEDGFSDNLTRVGEKYLERANEL